MCSSTHVIVHVWQLSPLVNLSWHLSGQMYIHQPELLVIVCEISHRRFCPQWWIAQFILLFMWKCMSYTNGFRMFFSIQLWSSQHVQTTPIYLRSSNEGYQKWMVSNRKSQSQMDDLGGSLHRGTPKSSMFIGFSFKNHPFGGTPMAILNPPGARLAAPVWRRSGPLRNLDARSQRIKMVKD